MRILWFDFVPAFIVLSTDGAWINYREQGYWVNGAFWTPGVSEIYINQHQVFFQQATNTISYYSSESVFSQLNNLNIVYYYSALG